MRAVCSEHENCVLLDVTDVDKRRSERVHAEQIEQDLFRLTQPPEIVRACALGDIVRATPIEDHLVVERVIRSSPFLVFRLEEQDEGSLDQAAREVADLGAVVNRRDRLVNVTFLPQMADAVLQKLLPPVQAGRATWQR